MKKMKIKGLIFDFDGLILDTETPDLYSWISVFDDFNIPFPQSEYDKNIGSNFIDSELADFLLHKLSTDTISKDKVLDTFLSRKRKMVESKEVMPGVKDYLDCACAKRLKIGLASSSGNQWISSNLNNLGIESYFDSIVTKDDVEKIKPYPDIYLLSINNMALFANEVIVFEDSYNGLSAAKAANLFTIVIPNKVTENLDFEKADMRLNSLADIPLAGLINIIESQSA